MERTRLSLILIWYSIHSTTAFHRLWRTWFDDLKQRFHTSIFSAYNSKFPFKGDFPHFLLIPIHPQYNIYTICLSLHTPLRNLDLTAPLKASSLSSHFNESHSSVRIWSICSITGAPKSCIRISNRYFTFQQDPEKLLTWCIFPDSQT